MKTPKNHEISELEVVRSASSENVPTSPFPTRKEVYINMHRNLINWGKLPLPELSDEFMSIYDHAGVKELNFMRKEVVQRRLAMELEIFQIMQDKIESDDFWLEDDKGDKLEVTIIDFDKIDSLLCEEKDHKELKRFYNLLFDKSAIFDQRIVNTIIQYLIKFDERYSQPFNEVIQRQGWTSENTEAFFVDIIRHMFSKLKIKSENVSVGLFVDFCSAFIPLINDLMKSEKDFIPIVIQERMSLIRRSLDLSKSDFTWRQTQDDKEKINKCRTDKDLAMRKLKNLRTSSDAIRLTLIPQLIKDNVSLSEAFWAIHAAHFAHDPFLTHMHDTSLTEIPDYAANVGGEAFYADNVGKTRKNYVHSCGTDHVQVRFLDLIESSFFKNLEIATHEVKNADDFLDLVTKVDMFMISAHLPFDAAGRTYEDFIVFLSHKLGYPLTISTNGYRGFASVLTDKHIKADNQFKIEHELQCLKNLGIEVREITQYDLEYGYVKFALAKLNAPDANLLFESEKALEIQRISNSLINGKQGTEFLQNRYKVSFSKLRDVLAQARKEQYFVSSNLEILADCDQLIFASRSDFTFEFRDFLKELQENFSDDNLAKFLADFFLSPKAPFVAEKIAKLLLENENEKGLKLLLENTQCKQVFHNFLGLLYRQNADYANAESSFRQAIVIDNSYGSAWDNLGDLLMSKENPALYDEAECCFENAIKFACFRGSVYRNLARLLRRKAENQVDRIVKLYSEYFSLIPLSTEFSNDFVTHEEFRGFLLANNKFDIAVCHFEKLYEVATKPQDLEFALFHLGELSTRKGNFKQAKLYYEEGIRIFPEAVDSMNNLGNLFRNKFNDPHAAKEYFKKATIINEDFHLAKLNLADTHLRLGELVECKRVLDSYAENGGNRLDAYYQEIVRNYSDAIKLC